MFISKDNLEKMFQRYIEGSATTNPSAQIPRTVSIAQESATKQKNG